MGRGGRGQLAERVNINRQTCKQEEINYKKTYNKATCSQLLLGNPGYEYDLCSSEWPSPITNITRKYN
jgi:hypothetical protein